MTAPPEPDAAAVRPTDAQRAEWTTMAGLYPWRDVADAIFAAGVEAAQAGMTVEWGFWPRDTAANRLPTQAGPEWTEERARAAAMASPWMVLVTRRVTDWQATP